MSDLWQRQLLQLPVEEVHGCLLCGIDGQPDSRWQKYLELRPPFNVLRCQSCGLRWLSPRPNPEGYKALYSNVLYFGGRGASPADYAKLADKRISYFRSRVRACAALLGGAQHLEILDYGAASGEFVRAALDDGHACVGVELSADARVMAEKRNGIALLSAEEAGEIHERRFDVVHMNHVLEHMLDPLSHVRWCNHILRSGGLLVLEVPQQFDNDLDRVRRCLRVGGKRPRLDAYSLHHTYFFNPFTMKTLLERAGFTIISIRTFNRESAPLRPFSVKNWALRCLLELADKLHHGGNVVEVFAVKV